MKSEQAVLPNPCLEEEEEEEEEEAMLWIFSLLHCVQTGSGARPTSCRMDAAVTYVGINWPGREADHSLPSNAEVKNAWSYISIPAIRFHGVVLN
jgi:hypothetical protein